MKDNDIELIQEIRKGYLHRRRAETKLFQQYQYFVQQAVNKYALDESELESAYCDAFMALVEQILDGRFRGESSTKTYLYRIFNNKCLDAVRKNARDKRSIHDTAWIEDWTHLSSRAISALKTLINQEMIEEVKQAFKKLGEKCAMLLTNWGRGYSAKEIADMLGYKNAHTIRTTKSRCMDKLLEDDKLREQLK